MGMDEEVKTNLDDFTYEEKIETSEPLILRQRKSLNERRKFYILRFSVMLVVVSVTAFLVVYAGYLIAVQYFNNISSRYNSILLSGDKYFYEVKFMLNNTKNHEGLKYVTMKNVTHALEDLKRVGITDIIISEILDDEYNLNPNISSERDLFILLSKAEQENIGVYLNLPRKVLKPIIAKRSDVEQDIPHPDTETTTNNSDYSCINSYLSLLKEAIQKYSSLGIDGFIINDVPCCVIWTDQPSQARNCSLESINELRRIARKYGKPSSIILKPGVHQYEHILSFLSLYNKSHFDGVIRLVHVDEKREISIPKVGYSSSSRPPHDIWHINFKTSTRNSSEAEQLPLIYGAISFLSGSLLLNENDTYVEPHHRQHSAKLSNETFVEDGLASLMSDVSKIRNTSNCESDISSTIFGYASNSVFYVVSTSRDAEYSHCALLINFGKEKTEVNMKTHFANDEVIVSEAIVFKYISMNGVTDAESNHTSKALTLEPKSGVVLKIKRKF